MYSRSLAKIFAAALALACLVFGCRGERHLTGGQGNFAFPAVPPNGCIGDLCSMDGGTAPHVFAFEGIPLDGGEAGIQPGQGWFLTDAGYYAPGPGGGGGTSYEAGSNNSQALFWNSGGNTYQPRQPTQDDILPGFAINSFTGGSTIELGATVTNPAFAASYSSTPASAQITNTDAIDSPLTLSTPFTSGTVVGSFHHTAVATVVFTLTAVGATTKTATSNITFLARTFSGLASGNAATGATASGSTAVLVGATGTLASNGLFSGIVGQSFGPFSPSSQYIDILTPHTSTAHAFHDQNGFGVDMLAPVTFTFTNQNGATISMDLYQTTNALGQTFTFTCVSMADGPEDYAPLLPANDNNDLRSEAA